MYSTYIAQRRDRLGPQDSGEWTTRPIKFRRLPPPTRTEPERLDGFAPAVIATAIVLGMNVATAGMLEIGDAALALLPLALIAPAFGVLWISQFRRVSREESIRNGSLWGMLGFVAMAAIHPGMLIGFLVAGLTGALGLLSAWLTARLLNRRGRRGNA